MALHGPLCWSLGGAIRRTLGGALGTRAFCPLALRSTRTCALPPSGSIEEDYVCLFVLWVRGRGVRVRLILWAHRGGVRAPLLHWVQGGGVRVRLLLLGPLPRQSHLTLVLLGVQGVSNRAPSPLGPIEDEYRPRGTAASFHPRTKCGLRLPARPRRTALSSCPLTTEASSRPWRTAALSHS